MKYLLFLIAILTLSGCGFIDWIVSNEDGITKAGELGQDLGGFYGAIAAFVASTAVAGSKWYKHKTNTKELIKAIQTAKDNMPDGAKEELKKSLIEHMPASVKRVVSGVKNKL